MKQISKEFESRLLLYSNVAALLFLSTTSLASVVENDIDDVIVTSGNSYSINFNGDAWDDVKIRNSANTMLASAISGYARFVGKYNGNFFYPYTLGNATSIPYAAPAKGVWGKNKNNNNGTLSYNSAVSWGGDNNQYYLGLKFKGTTQMHCAWIVLSIDRGKDEITIHKYAYETTPETDISAPLPVELTNFEALQYENAVKLLWETATEINNYGFEVERKLSVNSDQSSEWETLGFIEGHGNSNSPKSYEFIDETAPADALEYRLKQIDTDGKFEYYSLTAKVNNAVTEVKENDLPLEFALEQNYPNPFNPSTAISYHLSEVSHVELKVYDLLGKEVASLINKKQAAGSYTVNFNASDLTSGMYIYKIISGNFIETRKMILLK